MLYAVREPMDKDLLNYEFMQADEPMCGLGKSGRKQFRVCFIYG